VPAPPIDERSAVTAIPELVGFVPGVTVTVKVEGSPGKTELGAAAPVPDGLVEASTVREIEPLPERACASVIVKGNDFTPPEVPLATVAV
jgi:hypothetical protein